MAASATFIAKCRAHTATPRIRFTHSSSTYDSDVLEVSDIHRDSSLGSGQAVIALDNTDGGWNAFHKTNTAMGAAASISLYITVHGFFTTPTAVGAKAGLLLDVQSLALAMHQLRSACHALRCLRSTLTPA